jgi:hypothetical protein
LCIFQPAIAADGQHGLFIFTLPMRTFFLIVPKISRNPPGMLLASHVAMTVNEVFAMPAL